jgi:hypothetical protein
MNKAPTQAGNPKRPNLSSKGFVWGIERPFSSQLSGNGLLWGVLFSSKLSAMDEVKVPIVVHSHGGAAALEPEKSSQSKFP